MPGWRTIAAGVINGIAAFFGWREKAAEKDLRNMDREAGRNEQKVSNLEKDKANAATARKAREDADRADEPELNDGLRKYARKPRK